MAGVEVAIFLADLKHSQSKAKHTDRKMIEFPCQKV
jgi:hypothetical protein